VYTGDLEQMNFKTLASALPAQVNCAYACAAASQGMACMAHFKREMRQRGDYVVSLELWRIL
jgi:hypothetical protein